MTDFATRFGYAAAQVDLSEDEMPESLKNGLWDICYAEFFEKISGQYGEFDSHFKNICKILWVNLFKRSRDTIPYTPSDARKEIKRTFYASEFYDIYAFVEFMGNTSENPRGFTTSCNRVLERERAAFRFASKVLVKVTNGLELAEVRNAIETKNAIAIATHITRAAQLYSQVPTPDYRNSIKESISAVEAAVAYVTGRKTHGVTKALKGISEKYRIHQSLRDGFEKLYAWTSDASGIRHRLMDESDVSQDDARYMLIACSAFSNYLIALHARFGMVPGEP
jgi:hypothetical protein